MLDSEFNARLNKVIDDAMVQFPIVARKILMATKSKKSPVSSGMQFRVLMGLLSGPVKPSEISYIHCISKPNVTTLINKLIENGYAQRSHDETDRRVVYVTITEKGKKAELRYRVTVKKYLLKMFEQLDEDEIQEIFAGMEKFRSMLTKMNNII